jgi:hypothetical protein
MPQVNFHDELLQSLNQAQQREPLGPPLALEDRPSSSWKMGASAGSQLASKLSQNNRLLTVIQNMSHITGMQAELSLSMQRPQCLALNRQQTRSTQQKPQEVHRLQYQHIGITLICLLYRNVRR